MAVKAPQAAALVTGGGRGIGRSITRRLARAMPVVVVGRTVGDLEAVCAEVGREGGVAVACAGDVSDSATADRAVDCAQKRGWVICHLVCNAGIGASGATHDFSPELWRLIFDVNVHGCFYFVRACLAQMLERAAGAITIISSLGGVQGVSHDAAYSASKHALVGLGRSLALEYQKRGIVVSVLCPSFIESEMTRRTICGVIKRKGLSETEAQQYVAERSPAKRILAAEEIAEAVALIGAGERAAAEKLAAAGCYQILPSRE